MMEEKRRRGFDWEELPVDAKIAVVERMALPDIQRMEAASKECSRLISSSHLREGEVATGEWYIASSRWGTNVEFDHTLYNRSSGASFPLLHSLSSAKKNIKSRVVACAANLACLAYWRASGGRPSSRRAPLGFVVFNPLLPRHRVSIPPLPGRSTRFCLSFMLSVVVTAAAAGSSSCSTFQLAALVCNPGEFDLFLCTFDSNKLVWEERSIELGQDEFICGNCLASCLQGEQLYFVTASTRGAVTRDLLLSSSLSSESLFDREDLERWASCMELRLRCLDMETGRVSTVGPSLMPLFPYKLEESKEDLWNQAAFWSRLEWYSTMDAQTREPYFPAPHAPVPVLCAGRLVMVAVEFVAVPIDSTDLCGVIQLWVLSPTGESWELLSKTPLELVLPVEGSPSSDEFLLALSATASKSHIVITRLGGIHPPIVYEMSSGKWLRLPLKFTSACAFPVHFSLDTEDLLSKGRCLDLVLWLSDLKRQRLK